MPWRRRGIDALIVVTTLLTIVATFAVFMNVILILGILAAFNATFTLPGIAGIVLTVAETRTVNIALKVASAGETVVVTTEAPTIEPTSPPPLW